MKNFIVFIYNQRKRKIIANKNTAIVKMVSTIFLQYQDKSTFFYYEASQLFYNKAGAFFTSQRQKHQMLLFNFSAKSCVAQRSLSRV